MTHQIFLSSRLVMPREPTIKINQTYVNHAALQQADTYDSELFQSMGLKTIWLDSYDDIPALLDRIPAKPRKRK